MYIYSLPDWPKFHWDDQFLAPRLTELKIKQARLLGRMEGLGPHYRAVTHLHTIATELMKSSEIEGHPLNREAVYHAFGELLEMPDVKPMEQKIALKNIDLNIAEHAEKHLQEEIDGLARIQLDAVSQYDQPLFHIRLFGWHTAMYPDNSRQPGQIVGRYRNNPKDQPMKVVSGPSGRETTHFTAPDADTLQDEMNAFLAWFNEDQMMDPIIKAGIAHIWFLNIYPFSAGNGVIARMITEMLLCRADLSPQRYFSLSAQMRKERNQYFAVLERAGKDTMNVTNWLAWFIDCLHRALNNADDLVGQKISGLRRRDKINALEINERQRAMLNFMAEDPEAPVTSSTWARQTNSSQDSAGRDINDLLIRKILVKEVGGGRSTSYSLSQHLLS
jgi:Fic family protein